MSIEEAFGQVLKEERIRMKFSQEGLAHSCDLDRTYISLIERGKRKPTINTVFALAKPLEVSPHILLKKTEELLR
ncbi:DNA-binding transcriptional regulator, XRE-family HTH domain [Planococcus glaciei]|uniref:helix-turn-helix domain-containing protein n=1 Tax=Planococcus glaciei TaxID=459472 RepID=UPI0008850052|nr:helix-turn-helix transcriptional regulator [Planococcus glaciei]SDI20009.1 DNA-binding transcriptional regulator, XRE-family HTH domain [Planococcus glaciei]